MVGPRNVPSIQGFISDYDRKVHFDAHGAEFAPPFASETEYEAAAIAFMSKPGGATIDEALRIKDRAVIRWDTSTDEFGICDFSGHVTTYFIADPARHKQGDNLAYFRRRIAQ